MFKNHWDGGVMSGNRTIKAVAGLALSTALLSGVVSARADELSDLRANQQALTANQQLLQQRIDQLAAAANNMAPRNSRRR